MRSQENFVKARVKFIFQFLRNRRKLLIRLDKEVIFYMLMYKFSNDANMMSMKIIL